MSLLAIVTVENEVDTLLVVGTFVAEVDNGVDTLFEDVLIVVLVGPAEDTIPVLVLGVMPVVLGTVSSVWPVIVVLTGVAGVPTLEKIVDISGGVVTRLLEGVITEVDTSGTGVEVSTDEITVTGRVVPTVRAEVVVKGELDVRLGVTVGCVGVLPS